jgi:hypothetical protein
MALVVETGAGISGADSYASVAVIDAYWGNRQHTAFYTAWNAASAEVKEGAAREASEYLDARLATSYRGIRKGYLQGLEWPRSEARDDDDFDLPALPPQLIKATCELASRAVTKPLLPDTALKGVITKKSSKAGPAATSTDYGDGALQTPVHGFVLDMLEPILSIASGKNRWAWR